jgi:hypothetical protein
VENKRSFPVSLGRVGLPWALASAMVWVNVPQKVHMERLGPRVTLLRGAVVFQEMQPSRGLYAIEVVSLGDCETPALSQLSLSLSDVNTHSNTQSHHDVPPSPDARPMGPPSLELEPQNHEPWTFIGYFVMATKS